MASYDYTKVDPLKLRNASNNIEDNMAALERAFNTIDNTLLGTLKPTWTGNSGKAFFNQYSIDSGNIKEHMNSMKSTNIKLREAAGIYETADSNVSEMVNNLKVQ